MSGHSLFAPRWWPTWMLVGVLAAVARAPWRLRLLLGRALGRVLMVMMPRRRSVAAANIDLCFPELSAALRQRLVREHFRELGIAVPETLAAWTWPGPRLKPMLRMHGLQHMRAALAAGHGVLVVAAHSTCMEMAMQLISMQHPARAIYRRHKNPVLDRLIHRGRSRNGARLFEREDMRTLLSALRRNEAVWFSPDQDHGLTQGAFVDFFNQPAATVTTTARIAARTGAAVLPLVYRRLPGTRGYEAELLPALEDFPGNDLVAATRRLNHFIERQVRLAPDQYLWVHRRFKTRPPGAAPIYAR